MAKHADERGFSLIEVGIVLGVIGVLATVVIASRGFMQSARVRNAVVLVDTLRGGSRQFATRNNSGLSFTNLNFPTAPTTLPGVPANVATPWGNTNVRAVVEGTVATCGGNACVRVCFPVPGSALLPQTCDDVRSPFTNAPGVVSATCSSAGGAANCGIGAGIWTLAIVAH